MPKTYKQIMEEARRDVPEVSVEGVRQRLTRDGKATVLDVREKEEYREGHLQGAVSRRRSPTGRRRSSPTAAAAPAR